MSNRAEELLEFAIARKVINCLLTLGEPLSIGNGDEEYIPPTRDATALVENLHLSDEEVIYVGERGSTRWVELIWGNGEDIISDYTCNLEDVLTPANHFAEAKHRSTIIR